MKRALSRLEDFRLLPVFVVVSMAVGIAIGNALEVLAGDIRRHAFWIALALLMTTLAILAVRGRDYRGAAAAESLLVEPDEDSK